MRRLRGHVLLAGLLALAGAIAQERPYPGDREVLRQADEARGNLQGVSWEVSLESPQERTAMTLQVQARGFDVHAVTREPARSRGNTLLMVLDNMWFYKPGLSKPVPISRRQKLQGHAAYGDIAATNYADDYAPTRLPDEAVDGEPCYVYELAARQPRSTYDRIRYWVSQRRLVGVRGEYYTVSGKLFKSARMGYENRVRIEGREREFISRIVIQGELADRSLTTMRFGEPRLREIPDDVFNLNLLMTR